jgi:hypothetical protein
LPKFDPVDDILSKTHLDKFMLAMNIMNVQHEDVACKLFCLTLQGNASSWFFNLSSGSITSWQQFENAFITRFGDDKTSGKLLLELARLKIKENEKVKEFNQRFITLLNKIPDKPPEAIQIEYYTIALPLTVAMFVKRKEVRTLEENFEEAIQIEKDLASISTHRDNDESEASTSEKQGKKNKESYGKDVVIIQLQSEITSLKRSKREGKKPIKKKNTSHQIPPTSGINLEDYAMDNFCRAHYANHLEKSCPEFMNLFKAMILPWDCHEEDEEEEEEEEGEEEEEEEEELPSNHHLI